MEAVYRTCGILRRMINAKIDLPPLDNRLLEKINLENLKSTTLPSYTPN
jgi:hypothetical protein